MDVNAACRVDQLATVSAKLTQKTLDTLDMETLIQMNCSPANKILVDRLIKAEHAQCFRLNMIPVGIIGCSRRFLAQITRHKVGVEFVSTSLQYGEWCQPQYYGCIDKVDQEILRSMYQYHSQAMGRDMAGYYVPEGLLGSMIISATPWEWRHIIEQRTCNRNTPETKTIIEAIRVLLSQYSNVFDVGPKCMSTGCVEMMQCKSGNYGKQKEDLYLSFLQPNRVPKD